MRIVAMRAAAVGAVFLAALGVGQIGHAASPDGRVARRTATTIATVEGAFILAGGCSAE
jgi:hypothetical protein